MQAVAKPSTKIRVLCVDDSEDIPEMMRRCIEHEPDMENAGSLNATGDLLAEVKRTRADIVLLDMNMPGEDPLEALREVAAAERGGGAEGAGARVIAYSGRRDEAAVDRAAKAGAWGYVSKDAEIPRVLDAIREVAQGRTAFRRSTAR